MEDTARDKRIDDVLSDVQYEELAEGSQVDCSTTADLRQFVEAQMLESARAREEFSRIRFF